MNRCPSPAHAGRRALARLGAAVLLGASLSAFGQGLPSQEPRNFPPSAQFAEMAITNFPEVAINGQAVRTAPGFRLFSPERTLVFASNSQGQKFLAAFTIEPQTQWVHTAWVLTPEEIEKYKPVKPSLLRRLIGQ